MKMKVESVDRIYSSYAHLYDALFSWVFRPRVKRMVKELGIKPGDRVLELGFGTGLSLDFYPEGCEVVGVDICRSMLDEVKAKRAERPDLGYDLELLEMDATRLAFADDSFDYVIGCFMATVVEDPVKLVEEMLRVCKPEGTTGLVNHFRSENFLLGGAIQLINPITKRVGWRTDLKLSWLEQNSSMQVKRRFKLWPIFDIYTFVFFQSDGSVAPAAAPAAPAPVAPTPAAPARRPSQAFIPAAAE